MPSEMPLATFADGRQVPALGLGTYRMGENAAKAKDEVRALQEGIELGMALIDTAEMYASGGAEEIVGEAIHGRRDRVFLVSKVLPSNANRNGTIRACEASLRRLGTECLDLYLLHWRGGHPLEETIEAFERLKAGGKIIRWGVSNFDLDAMEKMRATDHGGNCAADQVLYNLNKRGVEYELKPWLDKHAMPLMAYCPLDEGRLLKNPDLQEIAADIEATPAQVALAFLLDQPNVIPIPKSASIERVAQNHASAYIVLPKHIAGRLETLFPPPTRTSPLSIV